MSLFISAGCTHCFQFCLGALFLVNINPIKPGIMLLVQQDIYIFIYIYLSIMLVVELDLINMCYINTWIVERRLE